MLEEEGTESDEEFDEYEASSNSMWIVTRAQLQHLADFDRSLKDKVPVDPLPMVARLYVKYLRVIQRLDAVWSNTFQVQKSQAMRRIIDAALMRLAELRNNLVELDISEFHYLDGALIEMKLVPCDLEIIPLSVYPIQRDIQLRELAERLFQGERIYEPPPPEDEEEEEEEETDEDEDRRDEKKIVFKRPVVSVIIDHAREMMIEGLNILQAHERARQGRLEYFDDWNSYQIKERFKNDPVAAYAAIKRKVPKEIQQEKATLIQSLWRGYRIRRDLKQRQIRSDIVLELAMPSWRQTTNIDLLKQAAEKKRKKREQKVQEYIETCRNEKERILRVVGPRLMEDIGDEIRYWFRYWYDVALAFDKIPPEEEGGTIVIIRGETMTPEEYRIEQERKRVEKEKLKNNPGLAKKMKEEAAKKKKEAAAAKKKEKERIKKEKREAKLRAKKGIIEPFKFKESPALDQLNIVEEQFDEEWTQLDEQIIQERKNDEPIMEKIDTQKCYETQLEMRKIVDEMMRVELQLLNEAHDRDRTGGKKGKKGQKKEKKKKGKKGKKAKKDPTGHRSTEDLFQELYDSGIIRQYNNISLDTFIGEYGYKNLELRINCPHLDPLPCVGEIRQVLIDNVILPLGGENVPKPKSVAICGPRQSGKHLLIDAICTETNAVMFDLSPAVLVGKYPGKAGKKMFLHLIQKMSRVLQPTVIYIDGAEKPFYKKIPKEEKDLDPRRLKTMLQKGIVKPIKQEDRVMVIAISKNPLNSKVNKMVKAFEKIILIPRTDYGTVFQVWQDILMKIHGVNRHFDVSSLAKVSIGYPIPYIRDIAAKVLCPARIIRLSYEPLRQHEILESLIRGEQPEPVTEKEYDKNFVQFFNKKTKIGKMKTKIVKKALELKIEEDARAEKAKAKANQKKK